MKTFEAEKLAKQLMLQHLGNDGDFKWGKAVATFGSCYYPTVKRNGYIRLSSVLTEKNSVKHVTDTILHEIAHALVGRGNGHNNVWKRKARQLGCRAEATSSDGVVGDPKFVMYSPNTGNIVHKWMRSPTAKMRASMPNRYERGNKDLTLGTLQIITWAEYQRII